MSLLLLRIPDDDDLLDADMSRNAVFLQVKDIAFDFGHLTADRNSLATNLDFLTQAAFKKIPHCYYSFFNFTRAAFIYVTRGVFHIVIKEARRSVSGALDSTPLHCRYET